MVRIKDMVHEDRPRERLWKQGSSSLKTSELLAILIRSGTKGKSAVAIGDEMMTRYQTLDNLGKTSAQELSKIKGLGMTKAVQLKAAFELAVRLSRSQALDQPVEGPLDVQRLLGEEMRQLPHESLRVIAVNTRLKMLAVQELSKGTINETVAHPRDVLRVGLMQQAYGIILVHNHPSGDPAPSAADLDFTLLVREAAKLMQIEFLDHIILGSLNDSQKGYYSFKESGYLRQERNFYMTTSASLIHPRAIIHPKAIVGPGTSVGPDAIIDEHAEIGTNCEIRARAIITGHTKLGSGNQIGYGAIVGAEPQDLGYKNCQSFTVMGDNNIVREYVTIHRGTKEGSATAIGDHNYLMTGVHIAHNCIIGNHVILVNNVLLGGYVEVKDYAFLGGDSVVHQFTRVGEFVMVRGQTRLGLDVPPYFMAVATNAVCGLNRVGLKRKGFDTARRKHIMEAYNILYYEGKNRLQALEAIRARPELRNPDVELLCRFVEETKRGICRAVKSGEIEDLG